MKQQQVAVVALLALLALLDPAAAAGLKFTASDVASDEALWDLYKRWGERFHVARDPAEVLRRFPFFKETALRVASGAGVELAAGGGQRAPGLNGFADLSADEFHHLYKCRRTTTLSEWRSRNNVTARPSERRGGGGDLPLPPYWDWRETICTDDQPCLGPIKDQGGCGSCWAFAATGAIEARQAIAGARNREAPVQLSQQQLIDCDPGSDKCAGGFAVSAFQYVIDNGISSSADYPYTAMNGTCHSGAQPVGDLVMRGFEVTRPDDEYQLLSAVTVGPVVVSISVGENNTEFMDYEGGVYRKKCGLPNGTDHELLLVGYDSTLYLLKNSYGEDWGDEGYLLLPRPDTNCGMLKDGGSYPNIGI